LKTKWSHFKTVH